MKIHWGTGLVIGMVLFMGFILYMVITMSTNKRYSHDLVTEAYYEKEMLYQNEIDAETNTHFLSEKISGKKTEKGWLLTFPEELEAATVEGTVFLYRPSNKQLDFNFPIELSGSNLLIPDKRLLEGRWNVTVDWTYQNRAYMYKNEITY